MQEAGHQGDAGASGGPLSRLALGWPRALYRWNEERYELSRMPYAVLQALNLGVLVGAVAISGAAELVVAVLSGSQAESGFWVGVSIAGAASMLVLAYLLWGGLLESLANRRASTS